MPNQVYQIEVEEYKRYVSVSSIWKCSSSIWKQVALASISDGYGEGSLFFHRDLFSNNGQLWDYLISKLPSVRG